MAQDDSNAQVGAKVEDESEATVQEALDEDEDVWLWGYGSLIYKHAMPFEEQCDTYVEGFVRRFWQGSPDRRGTPETPGLVVTLLSVEEAKRLRPEDETFPLESKTWGSAFRIKAAVMREELARLEHRERAGYDKVEVKAVFPDGRHVNALAFRATPENEHFVGPQPVRKMVEQIETAVGPWGTNIDYLVNLIKSLHEMQARVADSHSDVVDGHIAVLEENLTKPLANQ
mmetsp:Transcript_16466/g.29154  ORF Transcript_16466/g.29154 Transcript_16466/m.29154 type:complete len:229 (-) Transcript_16466:34-720(-)|eukprot:CAMPEP_0184560952 /NCGR_PEP_ID=MMETSP0199_2-20130426/47196_1 /TAXON_ID=1112570 /ORGANISM="Thraustochytrium sp., Strain LLF1b" /LENGTH=228 /DNA_ID=CAMNT_0026958261 /DNA_START=18 /DNA_END=704 /DNA_ORIENTATION=+